MENYGMRLIITVLLAVGLGVFGREGVSQNLPFESKVKNALKGDDVPLSTDSSSCVVFSKDQSVNKVPQFRKKYGDSFSSKSLIYSASFDLNDDGKPEYFYWLNDPGSAYCGTISLQIGCPLNIMRYRNKGNFTYIDYAIAPGLDFNPEKHRNYFCVSPHRTNGWHDLIEDRWWKAIHHKNTYQYDGTNYRFIQRKD